MQLVEGTAELSVKGGLQDNGNDAHHQELRDGRSYLETRYVRTATILEIPATLDTGTRGRLRSECGESGRKERWSQGEGKEGMGEEEGWSQGAGAE
jgi:hypothetical protein